MNKEEIIKNINEMIELIDDECFISIPEDIESIKGLLKLYNKLQKDNYKLDRENQHFFDRIQDLQKENEELKEDLFLEKSKLNDVLKCLLDFIPQNIHEVELKTKILNIIRGDNND